MSSRALKAGLGAVLFAAASGRGLAEEIRWVAPSGGVFGEPSNWEGPPPYFDEVVPGPADIAVFDIPSLYTVDFLASRQTDRVFVRRGFVTFEMDPPAGYELLAFTPLPPGLVVGLADGDFAELDVLGGAIDVGFASIAHESDAIGTLGLHGPDTALHVSGQLWVGRLGVGFLEATDGAYLSNASATIGQGGGAFAGATLRGPDTLWSSAGPLTIGNNGVGSLALTDGAVVLCGDAVIAQQANSSADVLVSGPGTAWSIDGTLDVALGGYGSLVIADGAQVSNHTFATIGTFPDFVVVGEGAFGSVEVRDAGSAWTIDGDLYVGFQHVGVLRVADDASVLVAGDAWVRAREGYGIDNGSGLTVSGGRLDIAGDMRVERPDEEDTAPLLRFVVDGAAPDGPVAIDGSFGADRDTVYGRVELDEGYSPALGDRITLMTAAAGLEIIDLELPAPPNENLFLVAVRRPEELAVVAIPVAPCLVEPGAPGDCDGNGIDDACDLAYEIVPDCDGNGAPDPCEVTYPVAVESDTLFGFYFPAAVEFAVENAVPSGIDVSFAVYLRARLLDPGTVTVVVNDVVVATFTVEPGSSQCTTRYVTFSVPAAVFNEALATSDDAFIELFPSASFVDACNSYCEVDLEYLALTKTDINANGVVDACETFCPADITGIVEGLPDGRVDGLDLMVLVGQWGPSCVGCSADITGPDGAPDGVVDTLDLLMLIAQWGSPANC